MIIYKTTNLVNGKIYIGKDHGSSVTKLGPAPVYSAVGSEPLWMFLKILAAAVDAKLPSTPGVMTAQAQSFEQLSTSKNVKLSL